jgi:hypothetical protein
MKLDRFKKWLRNIYKTQDEEISCTECLSLSSFRRVETSGQALRPNCHKQHLNQCPACRPNMRPCEIYDALGERQMPLLVTWDGFSDFDVGR